MRAWRAPGTSRRHWLKSHIRRSQQRPGRARRSRAERAGARRRRMRVALRSRARRRRRGNAGRTGDAGAAETAVTAGSLRQVLLVIVLGEVERAGFGDLGGDRAVPRPRELRLESVTG